MEYIDKNGSFVQRRKMYIGLPLHNMRSKVKFDWQNNDLPVQDQMGYKFKHKLQSEEIRKKYQEKLEKKIYSKYVEHRDDHEYLMDQQNRQQTQNDILSKELEHFNHSKIITPNPNQTSIENSPQVSKQTQDKFARAEKLENSFRLNQSQNMEEAGSPSLQRNIRQSSYEGRTYGQNNEQQEEVRYRYNRPYIPKNYATLNPATDRYRPYEPYPISYNYDYSSPLKPEKGYSSTLPHSYPLRNVIPDKLETHLREKVKADNKAVKVTLNLFDYKKR